MKKVISRNPRSTIGVKSTRVDSFLLFLTPGPFLWPPPPEVSISAIDYLFLKLPIFVQGTSHCKRLNTKLLYRLAAFGLQRLLQFRTHRRRNRAGDQLKLQLVILLHSPDHAAERRIFCGIITLDLDMHFSNRFKGSNGSPDPFPQLVIRTVLARYSRHNDSLQFLRLFVQERLQLAERHPDKAAGAVDKVLFFRRRQAEILRGIDVVDDVLFLGDILVADAKIYLSILVDGNHNDIRFQRDLGINRARRRYAQRLGWLELRR